MPKITVHGGPTNERAEPGEPGYVAPAEAEQEQEVVEPAPATEVEKPSARRTRKPRTPAGNASVTGVTVTAEAQVTRADGTTS